MTTAPHITQSPSPTPDGQRTTAEALYDAGHTEGAADATTDLVVATARAEHAFDHLAHPWAHGYWDGILTAATLALTTAWNRLDEEH
jgi:hypothetical protein